jgi:hypothetical protein
MPIIGSRFAVRYVATILIFAPCGFGGGGGGTSRRNCNPSIRG